ncbi:MAG: hypothetical protein GYA55_08485 [SAR324 cluster bacterium]|uniref:TPM domain-containing protein n=1 Tax=SAR324 cluster bacterium TaxID=2024889 RepID=A0A7X9IJJ9_9DELT|nr:hypothetical protein [SAR324 cluster bacterium]
MNKIKRILNHFLTTHFAVKRYFPLDVRNRIAAKIAEVEKLHGGEIVFLVEANLPPWQLLHNISPRARALELFSRFRVWDTEENCGVLLYILLADRQVEIIADRGIDNKVGQEGWQKICDEMKEAFRQGEFEKATFRAIEQISEHLISYFPRHRGDINELPDQPVIL